MKINLNIPDIKDISSELRVLSQVIKEDVPQMIEPSTILFLIFYTLLTYFILKVLSDSVYLIISNYIIFKKI